MIEAGLYRQNGEEINTAKKYTPDWLKGLLHSIDGINAVEIKNGIFQIGCSRDVTSEIAEAVIASGEKLNYLNKKAYGLDDIYYRYFEGGEKYE